MKIEHIAVSLTTVLHWYSKGFKPKGGVVKTYETFVDVTKGVVMFKLYVEKEPKKKRPEIVYGRKGK